jgi:rare lipoprotein A
MMIDRTIERAFARLMTAGLMAVTLAACTTSRAPTTIPPVSSSPELNVPDGLTYKVGNPYQIEGVWYYPSEDYSYVEEGMASWYGPDFHGKRTANGERYDMNAMTAAHPTLPLPSVVNVTNLENGRSVKLRINDRGPFKSKRIIDISRQGAQLLGFKEQGITRVRVEIDRDESLLLKNQLIAKNPGEMPKIAAAPRSVVSATPLAPPVGSPVKPAQRPPQAARLPTEPTPQAAVPGKSRVDLPGGTGVYIQAGAFSEPANAHRLEQQLREFGNVFIVTINVSGKTMYRVRLGPLQDDTGAESLLGQVKSFGYDDAQIVRF